MKYLDVTSQSIYGEGLIVGNTTDPAVIEADTVAMQAKLDLAALFNINEVLYFPWRHYRFDRTLTVQDRVRIYGQPMASQFSTHAGLDIPTVFDFKHGGTGIEVHGDFVEIKHVVFRGDAAQGNAIGCLDIGPGSSPPRAGQSLVEWCHFFRTGGVASVRIRKGGGRFLHNEVQAHFNPSQPSYDPTTMRPVRHHALYCPSLADHDISHNDLTGDGAGLFLESCGGLNVHDNFIYNSNVGVYMMGTRTSSLCDNRVDEHYREGVVIDWNSYGNTITGNRIHNCGARTTEAAVDRVGLLLRSGESNNVTGNIFDNWDHDVQQPGNLDFRSPQQYGLRIKGIGSGSQTRPLPQFNLIGMNTFHNQKTANVLNEGDGTNKFIGNVGRDFPNGLYADATPEPVTAGYTGPAAVTATAAAALFAFRERGRSARSLT